MPPEYNAVELHPRWCVDHDPDGYHRSASVELPRLFGVTVTAAVVEIVNPTDNETHGPYLETNSDDLDGDEYDAAAAHRLIRDLATAQAVIAGLVGHLNSQQVPA